MAAYTGTADAIKKTKQERYVRREFEVLDGTLLGRWWVCKGWRDDPSWRKSFYTEERSKTSMNWWKPKKGAGENENRERWHRDLGRVKICITVSGFGENFLRQSDVHWIYSGEHSLWGWEWRQEKLWGGYQIVQEGQGAGLSYEDAENSWDPGYTMEVTDGNWA